MAAALSPQKSYEHVPSAARDLKRRSLAPTALGMTRSLALSDKKGGRNLPFPSSILFIKAPKRLVIPSAARDLLSSGTHRTPKSRSLAALGRSLAPAAHPKADPSRLRRTQRQIPRLRRTQKQIPRC